MIKAINDNEVQVEVKGRIITVRSDDGTALLLAIELVDWSEYFRRIDEADEVTQILEAS